MDEHNPKHEEGVIVEDHYEVQEPSMYKVILLNDDYTTMEFVVMVLEQVFELSGSQAETIMQSVHEKGAGVAGIYTREIAETKLALVHLHARQNEHPLRCIMEPA